MNREDLTKAIKACHDKGQKVAFCFCTHLPQEIPEAAGICTVRLSAVDGYTNDYPAALPKNTCPLVRRTFNICEDPAIDEVDLLFTESSCDGKKKAYELLTNQDRLYYYQVPQGSEQDYVKPLIESECRYMIKMLKERFGLEVTDDALRQAIKDVNAERESVMSLLEIQKQVPPPQTGLTIFRELEKNRMIFDRKERTAANKASREALLAAPAEIKKRAKRLLITGCPLSGVYEKVIGAVEANGGVVVCFENCETAKAHTRHVDENADDLISALADGYRRTHCAIMNPNEGRYRLVEDLCKEYQVDGILDVTLQTCHAYSVETDTMERWFLDKGIPYMTVETDFTDADAGQLSTRIAAYIEML